MEPQCDTNIDQAASNEIPRYNRDELLSMRESEASKTKPDVNPKAPEYLFQRSSVSSMLPAFMINRAARDEHFRNSRNFQNVRQMVKLRPSTSETFSKDKSRSSPIHFSISLNKDVKLNETKNAWKPKHLKQTAESDNDNDELYHKIRGILNKLTPENFDKLLAQIFSFQIDTFEKVERVMNLVYEKAVHEPNFAVLYAKLCVRLADIETTSTAESNKKRNFKYILLIKTEKEFRNNVLNKEVKEKKLQPILEQIEECTDPAKKIELRAQYDDEERNIRKRLGGTVCFIGELFNHSMLTGKIINSCVLNLIDPSSEDKLECLCKLLTIAGAKFEMTLIPNKAKQCYDLEFVVKKMHEIVDQKVPQKISSRIRFMLQDVLDLRANKWKPGRSNIVPTSPQPIANYSKTDETKQSNFKSNTNNTNERGMDNFERHHYDKHGQDNWQMQTSRKNKAVDANKLKSVLGKTTNFDSETKLGNSSQFMWTNFTSAAKNKSASMEAAKPRNSFAALSLDSLNENSTKVTKSTSAKKDSVDKTAQGTPRKTRTELNSPTNINGNTKISPVARNLEENLSKTAVTELPTDKLESVDDIGELVTEKQKKELLKVIDDMVESALDSKIQDCEKYLNDISKEIRWAVFFIILSEYLHFGRVKKLERRAISNVVIVLFKKGHLTVDDFEKSYKEFCVIISDLIIDVPNIWANIFEFIGPLIYNHIISVKNLWNISLKETGHGKQFLKEFICYCLWQIGPNYTRQMWKSNELDWTEFLNKDDVAKFIEENKLNFLENENANPPLQNNIAINETIGRLKELLNNGRSLDEIADYLSVNVGQVDCKFIRLLTMTLCDFSIINNKLDLNNFHNICIPLLLRYIDAKEDRELQCLFTVQIVVDLLEHPSGLLNELFAELCDSEVIPIETFYKWRDSKAEPKGKGVAVKSLHSFFNGLANIDGSDGSS